MFWVELQIAIHEFCKRLMLLDYLKPPRHRSKITTIVVGLLVLPPLRQVPFAPHFIKYFWSSLTYVPGQYGRHRHPHARRWQCR